MVQASEYVYVGGLALIVAIVGIAAAQPVIATPSERKEMVLPVRKLRGGTACVGTVCV